MKIKFFQVKEFLATYEILKTKKMPVSLAYKINKIFKSMEEDATFLGEKFGEIVKDYCEKDESGEPMVYENGNLHIPTDKIDECNNKLEELNKIEIEVAEIKIPIQEFEGIELELSLMEGLMPFIEE